MTLLEPWQEVGTGLAGGLQGGGDLNLAFPGGGGEMKECAHHKVQSRVWKVSSLKRAQSCGDSRQEALEGPVRPGMQLNSLCEEGSDQPIRNQGSITTRHRAGLRASAVAVSTGGASRGGFSGGPQEPAQL